MSKKYNNKNRCKKCKKIIRDLPFNCRYCLEQYCGNCRLPEDHRCASLKEREKHNQERWKNSLSSYNNEKLENDLKSYTLWDANKTFYNPPKSRKKKKTNHLYELIKWILLAFLLVFIGIYSINYLEGLPSREPHVYYYPHTPISYSFSYDYTCNSESIDRVRWAFQIIDFNSNSSLSFEEVQSYGDIEIICYNEYMNDERAGFGGITTYEGSKRILEGSVELYKPNSNYVLCNSYPELEIHEILHSLGFDHLDSERSIMNSMGGYSCTYMDQEISNCLKHIYDIDLNYTCAGIPFIY